MIWGYLTGVFLVFAVAGYANPDDPDPAVIPLAILWPLAIAILVPFMIGAAIRGKVDK